MIRLSWGLLAVLLSFISIFPIPVSADDPPTDPLKDPFYSINQGLPSMSSFDQVIEHVDPASLELMTALAGIPTSVTITPISD